MAPYHSDLMEVAQQFAGTTEREALLRGLIEYREALRSLGLQAGFQWIDGSFLEDCERIRGRPPKDVDIVTFARRPVGHESSEKWNQLFQEKRELFTPQRTKELFRCDAYFIDLNSVPSRIVDLTRFWFGLFSHQRESFLWKGLVQVPLGDSDDHVVRFLEAEVEDAA